MGELSFGKLLIIAIVILVLVGAKKIPDFMRGVGKGIREFNDAKENTHNELENGINEKDNIVSDNEVVSNNASPIKK